jgi:hypothetical protein
MKLLGSLVDRLRRSSTSELKIAKEEVKDSVIEFMISLMKTPVLEKHGIACLLEQVLAAFHFTRDHRLRRLNLLTSLIAKLRRALVCAFVHDFQLINKDQRLGVDILEEEGKKRIEEYDSDADNVDLDIIEDDLEEEDEDELGLDDPAAGGNAERAGLEFMGLAHLSGMTSRWDFSSEKLSLIVALM